MKKNRSYKTAAEFLGITALLVLLCSCLSFDIGDWPSSFLYPHNKPAENLCGPIGAFCAYYLTYSIGPGVLVILSCAICFLFARLINRPIGQLPLRSVGVALLTVAVSSSFYCLWPYKIYNFPTGSGGLIGVATAEFLRSHFATLGTFILISAIWIVGLVLLADTFVIVAARAIQKVLMKTIGFAAPVLSAAKEQSGSLLEIWRQLSIKQKLQAITTEKLHFDKDLHLEKRIKPKRGATGINETGKPKANSNADDKTPLSSDQIKRSNGPIPASYEDYTLPPLELLAEPEYSFSAMQGKIVKSKSAALEQLLSEFNINAKVVSSETGPVVTMFELELAAGVKVSQISALANDMARALSAGAVRVVAPLPGKHTIGIEVPNSEKEKVRIKDLIHLAGNKPNKMQIPLYFGKDSSAEALVSDLAAMPHLLIAGTTGSGKSVCINSIISSILLTRRPDEVKLILIDPKMVEMTAFNMIPHLMSPIITETSRAVQVLEWATVKMDERYSLLAEARVKNLVGYNKLGAEEIVKRFDPATEEEEAKIPKRLPNIVIIIDELADLMMTAAKEIEAYIVRLAQKSRAVGIHIVLATQRPQATVVTGLIKSNMPCRIGFRVAARMDSRIILDQNGAETLLGEGDMLFLKPGTSDLIRAQGCFLDDGEIRRIVKHLKEIAQPQFHPELTQLKHIDPSEMLMDELFDSAVRIVLDSKRGSVSLLQRRLSIGYARASRIIEMMAASGVLGEYKGSQAREVIMTLDEYERICEKMAEEAGQDSQEYDNNEDEQETAEPVYVSEGQQEYIAVDDAT
ncbi:MAG: FtsK/SpoIIIE family DNA translocase [Planctomycetota bacterium]